ncbi:hypothetical protein GO009_09945 [Muricauda sp. TY007]|uniref:SGNH/GDSL hydrolase family protein n=1 Tax=Allomuricauda sp. TY007 TaxID=2683200 RepID=UPI0013C04880|nr:SGNH/GDSL hydrolase family protein [Muricauda sp. TY007]NDV16345.1 hypothetical protein [Muricauda sp. TY007]
MKTGTILASLLISLSLLSCVTSTKRDVTTSNETAGTSENALDPMNHVFVPDFIDTCTTNKREKIKLLIIGNSLSFHGIAPDIGWTHESGMAASKKEMDYAHLLFQKIKDSLPQHDVCMRISNFASFERNPITLNDNSINALHSFQADIIVFQLGENVDGANKDTMELFEKKYIELIQSFRGNGNPVIILTTPFFPSHVKNKTIKKVALSTKSYLVDLSHLTLINPENYAKNEVDYKGDKSIWKVEGIGIHPGDIGMENIANLIFIAIQPSMYFKSF